MLKLQRTEASKFKREMKNFYYDYRGLTEECRDASYQK